MNENNKHFTPEEIGKMTTEEFKANEPTIMEQIRTGNIGKPSDNIDVTGCEFYDKGMEFKGDCRPSGYCYTAYLLGNNSIYCKDNPNCHYKIALNKQKTIDTQAMEIVQLEQQLQQKEREYNHLFETHDLSMSISKSHIKQLEEMCKAKDAEIEKHYAIEKIAKERIEQLDAEIELLKRPCPAVEDSLCDLYTNHCGLICSWLKTRDEEIEELKASKEAEILGIFNEYSTKLHITQSNLNKAIEGLEEISKMKKFDYDSEYTINLATQTLEEIKEKEVPEDSCK